MLKLSVGYQLLEDEPFCETVRRHKEKIEEVYFAYPDFESGRSKIPADCSEQFLWELCEMRKMGIRLDLLFNANCYGENAVSRELESKVLKTIEKVMPEVVSTTSPFVAFTVKNHFPEIQTRASVNMKISSIKGMQYVLPIFDSFCLAKECNRDLENLSQIREFAKQNKKHITLLANSGCMRNCSGQIFHDNLVAHEHEILKKENVPFMPYTCWNFLRDQRNFVSVLQNTWIRPEDIHRYEPYCDLIKLATRIHTKPQMVIGAYAREKYMGNLLDLFEPGFSPAFAPYIIDSTKIPEDFWQKTTACNKNCEKCSYCNEVLQKALLNADA